MAHQKSSRMAHRLRNTGLESLDHFDVIVCLFILTQHKIHVYKKLCKELY